MPTIYLMTGFIGFGKTTVAKEIAKKLSAVRLTHDELMVERYGNNPDNFEAKYQIVDDFIKDKTAEYIEKGKDVILDYGFWTHKKREEYYTFAKSLTNNVIFHVCECEINEAEKRVLNRTKNDSHALFIDENIFFELYKKYEPWGKSDQYPVVFHNAPISNYIGQIVFVKVDRPKGSHHLKYGFEYPLNYGYVPLTKSGDGEELDAYILSVNEPVHEYKGKCIGVIHRLNDDDDKLIVVPDSVDLSDEEIEKQTAFQEKWFQHVLIRKEN